ncbi:MAG: hypothetical protein P8Y47_09250, partial [Alphaproteobacteria bacterium]
MFSFSIIHYRFNIKQLDVLIVSLLLSLLASVAIIQTADAASFANKPQFVQNNFANQKEFTKISSKKRYSIYKTI